MLEGLEVELPRTLPGSRELGELEVAHQAADTLLDRLVAVLGMSGPTFAGWFVAIKIEIVRRMEQHYQPNC